MMADFAEIDIYIKPDGTAEMEGVGFVGEECIAAMKDYQDALGVTVRDTPKPELAQRAPARRAPPRQIRRNK
jgi:hypothetical protein